MENFRPGALTLGVIAGMLSELKEALERIEALTGRRAERLVKIEKLLEYLKLYAKSLVETILRRERDGLDLEIPRRPTQRQLAAKLGMTQSDISNCLRDKSAVLLRLIWENLDNPEGLIRVLGGRG